MSAEEKCFKGKPLSHDNNTNCNALQVHQQSQAAAANLVPWQPFPRMGFSQPPYKMAGFPQMPVAAAPNFFPMGHHYQQQQILAPNQLQFQQQQQLANASIVAGMPRVAVQPGINSYYQMPGMGPMGTPFMGGNATGMAGFVPGGFHQPFGGGPSFMGLQPAMNNYAGTASAQPARSSDIDRPTKKAKIEKQKKQVDRKAKLLETACRKRRHDDIVKLLTARPDLLLAKVNADLRLRRDDKVYMHPLCFVVESGTLEQVKTVAEMMEPSELEAWDITPLIRACHSKDVAPGVIKYLVERGPKAACFWAFHAMMRSGARHQLQDVKAVGDADPICFEADFKEGGRLYWGLGKVLFDGYWSDDIVEYLVKNVERANHKGKFNRPFACPISGDQRFRHDRQNPREQPKVDIRRARWIARLLPIFGWLELRYRLPRDIDEFQFAKEAWDYMMTSLANEKRETFGLHKLELHFPPCHDAWLDIIGNNTRVSRLLIRNNIYCSDPQTAPQVLSMSLLVEALKSNTSLSYFEYHGRVAFPEGDEQNGLELLEILLTGHNTTLTHVKFRGWPLFDQSWETEKEECQRIRYLLDLNYYGIGQVRNPTIERGVYVSLLDDAMDCPDTEDRGICRRYWEGKYTIISSPDGQYRFWEREVSVLYGLLRESPGVWSKQEGG